MEKCTLTEFKKRIDDLAVSGGDVLGDNILSDMQFTLSNHYGLDINIYSAYAQTRQNCIRARLTSLVLREKMASAFEINLAHKNHKRLKNLADSLYMDISNYHVKYTIEKSKRILGGK